MNIYTVIKRVKDNMELSMIEPRVFVRLEILFRLCEKLKINKDADDFYLLLSGYNLIIKNEFDETDYLIANARILLKSLNQAKVYHDALEIYKMQANKEFAMYNIDKEGKLIRNNKIPLIYRNRIDDYDELLMQEPEKREHTINYALDDTKKYGVLINKEEIEINLPKKIKPTKILNARSKKGGSIRIKLDDIYKEAALIDKNLKGEKYRENVLENGNILVRKGKKIEKCSEFVIDKINNTAGQVAAGKSVLAECISVLLAKRGYRTLLIKPTVDDVFKQINTLEELGIKAAAIVGNSNRIKHINALMQDKNFLPEHISEVLQGGCFLNSLIKRTDIVIKNGSEPCHKIYEYSEDINDEGKAVWYLNKYNKYKCPFYYMCPKTKYEKKIYEADVLVTTIEGLCKSNFGIEKQKVFTYALDNVDLIIMDESDNIMCTLDGLLSPSIGINEYLKNNSKIQMNFRRMNLKEKTESEQMGEIVDLLSRLEFKLIKINQKIQQHKTGFSESYMKHFTALSLLNNIKSDPKLAEKYNETNRLPDGIWQALYDLLKKPIKTGQIEIIDLVTGGSDLFNVILSRLKEYVVDSRTSKTLKRIQAKKEVEAEFATLNSNMYNKIQFIVEVIGFEQLYRKLSDEIRDMDEVDNDLRDILSQNFEELQKVIPMSPIGNTLAFEKKEDDLYITKQYGFGRSLALKYPWFKLSTKGEPLGPNVLLMSGTGFIPGSSRYHISAPITNIIEAEPYKREYLSKTKMHIARSETIVSGVSDDLKNKMIDKLIRENRELFIDSIERNDTILGIVNKYEQASISKKCLDSIFAKKDDILVSSLKSDGDRTYSEDSTLRSRIEQFDKQVLIAPAIVIERGYNIVDNKGNSKFDTIMFLVRPMVDPRDYLIHVQKVNGKIMCKYNGISGSKNDLEIYKNIRISAFAEYNRLSEFNIKLKYMPKEDKRDLVACFFVMLNQVFGRICRIGKIPKEKVPRIYFIDGAFKRKEEDGFDILIELQKYLEDLMNDEEDAEVAKTLYEPFYNALKGADYE